MIKRVEESYKRNLPGLVFGPLIKLIEAVFDLLMPLIMKAIIDLNQYLTPENIPNSLSQGLAYFIRSFPQIGTSQSISDALIGGIIILIMGIVGYSITMTSQYIAALTSTNVATEVRASLFSKILSLSKKEKDEYGSNKLLTILNSDTYQLQYGVLLFARLVVRAPFILLGSLVFSFILDWRIGLAFLAIVPLISGILFFILSKSRKNYIDIQGKLDDISTKSSDSINGARVVRAFSKQDDEISSFKKKSEAYQNKYIHVNKINSLANPLTFAITSIVTIAILFLLRETLLNGSDGEKVLMSSTVIAEMAYLAQIFFVIVQLTNTLIDMSKASVSRKRINEVLSLKSEIVNGNIDNEIMINEEAPLLEFKEVYFSYKENSNNYALYNISFSLLKGETLGIIGGTGSGKSTIGHLIERFINPSKGTIIYKGQSIDGYNLSSIRKEIGLVNQKATLFKGTIRSNLLMGDEFASEEELILSLKRAEAFDFVSKYDDFLNHQVNENGNNFSGGQKQRLSIARALIKKPQLLILDDATSALDLLTDKRIRDNISNLNDITKIIISQRVATVSRADKIIVLDKGQVVGYGNNEELLKNCQIYQEIYHTQIKKG